MLFELDNETIKTHVFESKNLILVDFYATWCKSCEQLENILEELSDDYYGKLKIYKYNVENSEDIVNNLNIYGLPTIILFENGSPKKSIEGLLSAKAIKSWLAL